MEKFKTITSRAIPLPLEEIDTDQIIPARFLKAIDKEGFGENLFRDWRYDKNGGTQSNFVLNNPVYSGTILVAGKNFGCGSSREHAAWALYDYGFRVIISSYFADIFKDNALNNGVLPIQVSSDFLNSLFLQLNLNPSCEIKISLEDQTVEILGTIMKTTFQINAYKKNCLLNGFDDIDLLINMKNEIEQFEKGKLIKGIF